MAPVSASDPSIATTSGPTTSFPRGPTTEGSYACSTIVDECTRECLAIRVQRRMTNHDVLYTLSELFLEHGIPKHIRLRQRTSSSSLGRYAAGLPTWA